MIKCFTWFLLFTGIIPITAYCQQEMLYSQYMFNGLVVNPAYAGYRESLNVNLLHRSQWIGIKGAPNTQSLIVDGSYGRYETIGIGLTVVNDKAGIFGQTSGMINGAYRMPVGQESRLSFGLGIGLVQFSLSGSKAEIADANDPAFAGNHRYMSPDARVGLFFNNEQFYVGISANNLLTYTLNKNRPGASYVVLPQPRVFATVGGIMNLNTAIKFKPSLMVRSDPRGLSNVDLNASFLFAEKIWIGGSYRMGMDVWRWKREGDALETVVQKTLIGLVEVYVSPKLRVGYAFDYNTSALGRYSNGSHEISISYTIGSPNGPAPRCYF